MALGDPASVKMRGSARWVVRACATVGDAEPTARELLLGTEFELPDGPGPAAARRPEHRPPGFLDRLLDRWNRLVRPHSATLIDLMERIHDVELFGTSDGIEAIAVPFPHLIFLAATASDDFRQRIEPELIDQLRRRWGNLVDRFVGIRTMFVAGRDIGRDEIVAFFGRGIFVPAEEQLIGRVDIRTGAGDEPESPVLPDMRTPAGIYRGQAALAFSPREQLAPATSSLLPDEAWLFRVRGNPSRDGPPLLLEAQNLAVDGGAESRPVVASIDPPRPGYDASFEIRRGPDRVAEVSIVEDDRPSRLHRAPPAGSVALEIVGFVAPESRDDFRVDRWWIDLDATGCLVASAMRPKAVSIVCEGTGIYAYDWRRLVETAHTRARLGRIETPDGASTVLWAEAGAGFGYLKPPERRSPVLFAEMREARATVGRSVFQLDWLDFAGAAETWSKYAERHAFLAERRFGGATQIPGTADATFPAAGWLARARGMRDHPFLPHWDGTWQDETELIVGPLVLRVTRPGGPA